MVKIVNEWHVLTPVGMGFAFMFGYLFGQFQVIKHDADEIERIYDQARQRLQRADENYKKSIEHLEAIEKMRGL